MALSVTIFSGAWCNASHSGMCLKQTLLYFATSHCLKRCVYRAQVQLQHQLTFSITQDERQETFKPGSNSMIIPLKPVDAQADCPLFKSRFPSELRNQIYALIFTIETSEDGSIELNGATRPPSKALTMTCQRLYNETFAMYRAAYRSFPNHTFTVDMEIRTDPPNIPREIGNDLLSRINSFRIT
jgi:hypothetical protein